MCLISVLPKGTKKDTKEVYDFIKNGFNCNRDGSGFMYKRNGDNKITIDKGYFNLDKLIDNIKALKLKEEDELVIHHRIGTSGKVIGENTHPFLISDKPEEINSKDITIDKPALVHNGMFYGILDYSSLNKDFCDSYAFARYIMTNKNVMDLLLNNKYLFKIIFNNIIGSDKVCFLFPDRDLVLLGDFIKDNDYYHSNSGYCKSITNIGGHNYYGEFENELDFEIKDESSSLNNNYNNFLGNGLPKLISKSLNNKPDINNLKYSEFPITENNFKYFFYKIPDFKNKLYYLESFHSDSVTQSFMRRDNVATIYLTHKTEDLLNDKITFVPKSPAFSKAIVDYFYLVEKLPNYSKNRLKKTERILNEELWLKGLFDEVSYRPLRTLGYNNNKFYKLTLLLYVDYLKSKANTVNATDFTEDAVVVD